MRRLALLAVCTMLFASGCARPEPGSPGNPPPSVGTSGPPTPTATMPGSRDAQILAAVLRRYLTSPGENSFPGASFPVVFVVDRTDPDAADPMSSGGAAAGTAIAADDQQWITDVLAGVGDLRFVSDRADVLVNTHECAQVRDGGILIQLGTPRGGADRVEVGIFGFVACLGATWLTYVIEHDARGWSVTGTTGPMAIA
jgi:hypothetical protein